MGGFMRVLLKTLRLFAASFRVPLDAEDVIIIHPSARDWKLFMYDYNDVRRKRIILRK